MATFSTDIFVSAAPARPALNLIARVAQMLAVRRQRQDLAALDAAQLADVGITRAAAQAEANRPVWDVPATWRH